jgi:hypothetical protein
LHAHPRAPGSLARSGFRVGEKHVAPASAPLLPRAPPLPVPAMLVSRIELVPSLPADWPPELDSTVHAENTTLAAQHRNEVRSEHMASTMP